MTSGVMVVGMHRSGTSAVTRVINLLGVPLGREDDIYTADDNPGGHWESVALCALNDVTLRSLGGFDMAMPPMPPRWLGTLLALRLRQVMRVTFDDVFRGDRWLWKDPRICLTLPIWRQVLSDYCAVFVVRNAGPVTNSLHRREGFPTFYCHALWDDYNRRAVAGLAGLPVVTVDFDAMLVDPQHHVRLLADGLSSLGVKLDGNFNSAVAAVQRPGRPDSPGRPDRASSGPGRRLVAALRSAPAVSQEFQPPRLPMQPPWVRPTLRAGRTWFAFRERWIDR
jgi:hypothetical protein